MQLAVADRLSKMSGAERAKVLADGADPRVLAAVFQLPAVLHGVDPGLVTSVRNKIVSETKPTELANLNDKAEALELAFGAVRMAKEALLGASDMPAESPAAQAWLEGLTKPSDAELASEKATLAARENDPWKTDVLNRLSDSGAAAE
jgi:hypothetical protein